MAATQEEIDKFVDAARGGRVEEIKEGLKKFGDDILDKTHSKTNETAAERAVWNRRVEILSILLENGAHIKSADPLENILCMSVCLGCPTAPLLLTHQFQTDGPCCCISLFYPASKPCLVCPVFCPTFCLYFSIADHCDECYERPQLYLDLVVLKCLSLGYAWCSSVCCCRCSPEKAAIPTSITPFKPVWELWVYLFIDLMWCATSKQYTTQYVKLCALLHLWWFRIQCNVAV